MIEKDITKTNPDNLSTKKKLKNTIKSNNKHLRRLEVISKEYKRRGKLEYAYGLMALLSAWFLRRKYMRKHLIRKLIVFKIFDQSVKAVTKYLRVKRKKSLRNEATVNQPVA